MTQEDPKEVLRICVSSSQFHRRQPVYEVIVEEARRRGLAGATVLKGNSGFILGGPLSTGSELGLPEGVPVIVEIIEAPEKIEPFMGFLEEILKEGSVARIPARARTYRR